MRRAATSGATLQAALRHAAESDVVVVAAAGNAGVGGCLEADRQPGQVALPGWYGDDLLTVGAVDALDAAAPFTVPGPWVDVAAPGTGLRSLTVDGGLGGGLDGTSFAAPWVAGLAALVRERFPHLTARQVADRILATARRPAAGRDDATGRGVIDPVAALTAEPAVLTADPPAANPAAVLPGTAPTAVARTGRPAADLVPVGMLLAVVGAAAALLRRRPRLTRRFGPRREGRRPSAPSLPRPAPDRWAAAATPPRERPRCG